MELYDDDKQIVKNPHRTIPYMKSMDKMFIIQFSYIFKNN